MKKFCVFCGNKPENKNKEHIIPKWLIRLTGDENRIINLGINYTKLFENANEENIGEHFKNRTFTFANFQFPACKSCNDKYSKLENLTSVIFKAILNNEYVSSDDLNILLDWFDKLRIGLWLGSISLDKIKDDVNPNYYINQRIAKRDRALFVYKLNKLEHVGINFYGYDTPGFQFAPCVVGFRVNNYLFINYSKEDLLAKNLGFVYAEFINVDQNSRAHVARIRESLKKIRKPVISTGFPKPTMVLYQAIFSEDMFGDTEFDNYTKSNLSQKFDRRSQIFYYDSVEKDILKLNEEDEILIDGVTVTVPLFKFNYIINNSVIKELENVLKFNHHKNLEDKEKADGIENNRKYVLTFHKAVGKLIKEFSKKDNS